MRALLAAVVVALLAVGTPASSATGALPVWLPPVAVTTGEATNTAWSEDVAVDPKGDLIAVWAGQYGVGARFRPVGQGWQAPTVLAACGEQVRVAFDGSGRATAAWAQCENGLGSAITTATRRLDGTWTPVTQLSTPGRQAGYVRLAVAGSGAAVVSWGETDGKDWVVEASARDPGSETWGRPTQLSSVGATAYESSPAVDDRGDAVVGYQRGDGGPAPLVWTSYRPAGGDWQEAQNRSANEDYSQGIQTAVRPDGEAIAVWLESGEGRWAARSPSTGAWSEPAPFPGWEPDPLTTDTNGDVLATWEWQGGVLATELPVGAATWREPFPTPTGLPQSYRVGFDGSGGLVAVWGNQNGNTACTLAASHRPAGAAGWTSPIALSGLSGSVWGTRYAIGTAGDVYAAYEAPNGTALEVATLDTAAPAITAFHAPRTGRIGRRLVFSATASDLSGATLRWSFGDGRYAAGATAAHVYRKAGRYRVAVTATDPAGHATTARATVAIAPQRHRR